MLSFVYSITLHLLVNIKKNTFPFWINSSPLPLQLFDNRPSEPKLVPNSYDLPVSCICCYGTRDVEQHIYKHMFPT